MAYLEGSVVVSWDTLWVKLLHFEGQPTDPKHKRKFQSGTKLNPS